jgi:hypothetical protein
MRRRRIRALAVGAMLLGLLGGCSSFEPTQPHVAVTIYGRNARADEQWFALVPLGDPLEGVGFGADGVACLHGPIGSEIARFDGVPGVGGRVLERVGAIVPEGAGDNVFWVSIAPNGLLTRGEGVPAWWQGDPQVC